MLKKIFACSIATVLLAAFSSVLMIKWGYQIKTEGTLKLQNAWGDATIRREKDTKITHISGSSMNSVVYAQGFAHAQSRLWQMEMHRRYMSGTLSSMLGPDLLPSDTFMRSFKLREMAETSY